MIRGKGKLFYSCGSVYKGYFENNKIEGFGCYTTGNRTRYIGSWLDCKLHGAGMIHYPDGLKKTGLWEYGKKII